MKLPRCLGALLAASVATVRERHNFLLYTDHADSVSKTSAGGNSSAAKGDPYVQVMMDLDDTVICSGGHAPKGIDKVCAGTSPGDLYPGVAAFLYAVARGGTKGSWGIRAPTAAPLSARPDALKAVLGMRKCDKIDVAFRTSVCGCSEGKQGCHDDDNDCMCFGISLELAQYGGLFNATDFALEEPDYTGAAAVERFTNLGMRKFTNWRRSREFIKYPVVFVGDNGQGDLIAAQEMLKESRNMTCEGDEGHGCPGQVIAAFIHDVRPGNPCKKNLKTWEQEGEQGLYCFDDYFDAAEIALEARIISPENHEQVVDIYNREFIRPGFRRQGQKNF